MLALKIILFVIVCDILLQTVLILRKSGLSYHEKAFMLINIIFYCIISLVFGLDFLSNDFL